MTQTESDGSILDAWSENPVATAAAVALGVAIGAGVVFGYFLIMVTACEATIRIKNGGSIHLEVLHKNRHWNEVGSTGMHWRTSGGEKLDDKYWLFLSPTNPAECKNKGSVDGNDFIFVMNDNTEVRVVSVDKKTEVISTQRLARSGNKKELSYGTAAHYIKEIKLGSDTPCTFGAKDDKLHTLLTEYTQ